MLNRSDRLSRWFEIEIAGSSEHRFDRLPSQKLSDSSLVNCILEERQNLAVCSKGVPDVLVAMGEGHIVKSAPEYSPLDHFLLNERF
jgi:hypothetical protein